MQILGELRFSLRRDVAPQYCDTLSGLYGYLQSRLIQAHAEKSESMLQEVQGLIQTLLDGWIGAMQNLRALESPRMTRAPDARRRFSVAGNGVSASHPRYRRRIRHPYIADDGGGAGASESELGVLARRWPRSVPLDLAVTIFAIPSPPRAAMACEKPCSAISITSDPV